MWFFYALVTSLLTAVTVVISKRLLRDIRTVALTWTVQVLTIPVVMLVVLKEGLPSFNLYFIFAVFTSVFLYTISKVFNFRALRMEDLSKIYPLTSFGPIFTAILASFPPLSERLTIVALIGMLITLVGSYVLNVEVAREGLFKPFKLLITNKASLLMIIYSLIISFVVISDKLAISNTFPKSSTFALFAENIVIMLGLLPFLYVKDRYFLKSIFKNKNLIIFLGLITAIKDIIGFTAIGEGNVGLVTTIYRTQMLWVLLFSYIIFQDKPKKETIIGSIIMLIGVVLIKIGS